MAAAPESLCMQVMEPHPTAHPLRNHPDPTPAPLSTVPPPPASCPASNSPSPPAPPHYELAGTLGSFVYITTDTADAPNHCQDLGCGGLYKNVIARAMGAAPAWKRGVLAIMGNSLVVYPLESYPRKVLLHCTAPAADVPADVVGN